MTLGAAERGRHTGAGGTTPLPFAFLLLISLLLLLSIDLTAQIPPDTLPSDTMRVDTVNTTAKYLEAIKANSVVLPVLPLIGVDGPRVAGSRIVLSRDSLEWSTAETLSDLLQRVPGVYLWRGGWVGRTEYPDYRGRGPASVEYFVDGLAYVPIGPDSLGVDPSFFSLSLYDRVEIEQYPAGLRVHLFTRRHNLKAPGSRIGIAAGDKSIARYIGALEKRFPSGIGFAMGGERMVAPTATGTSSDFDLTNIWLQASYVPSSRFGVQAEVFNSNPDRKPYIGSDTLELGQTGKRRDAQLRVFWRRRSDDMGLRVDLLGGETRWSSDSIKDRMRQAGVVLGWRSPTVGLGLRAFNRSRLTPVDLSATAGWSPADRLNLSFEGVYQRHDHSRQSRWVALRGGLGLPLGWQLSGTLRTGDLLATPALKGAPVQRLTDWQGTLGWQRKWGGVELGYGHSDGFLAEPFRSYTPTVDSFAPAPAADWVTVGWRLAPKSWLTLQGWYSDPTGKGTPDGVPATHSLTTGTIRSKFWRTFPSGIFDFRATIGYETWGDGIIGRLGGQPVALPGASFWRTMIEIRLDQFMLYWDRYNLQGSRKTYVPGFNLPTLGATFGVRWQFTN